jgi:hypothetical protein
VTDIEPSVAAEGFDLGRSPHFIRGEGDAARDRQPRPHHPVGTALVPERAAAHESREGLGGGPTEEEKGRPTAFAHDPDPSADRRPVKSSPQSRGGRFPSIDKAFGRLAVGLYLGFAAWLDCQTAPGQ